VVTLAYGFLKKKYFCNTIKINLYFKIFENFKYSQVEAAYKYLAMFSSVLITN
jgi:hypothetical protein